MDRADKVIVLRPDGRLSSIPLSSWTQAKQQGYQMAGPYGAKPPVEGYRFDRNTPAVPTKVPPSIREAGPGLGQAIAAITAAGSAGTAASPWAGSVPSIMEAGKTFGKMTLAEEVLRRGSSAIGFPLPAWLTSLVGVAVGGAGGNRRAMKEMAREKESAQLQLLKDRLEASPYAKQKAEETAKITTLRRQQLEERQAQAGQKRQQEQADDQAFNEAFQVWKKEADIRRRYPNAKIEPPPQRSQFVGRGAFHRPETPPVPGAPAPAAAKISAPATAAAPIPWTMKQALKKLGYTEEEVAGMSPSQVKEIVKQRKRVRPTPGMPIAGPPGGAGAIAGSGMASGTTPKGTPPAPPGASQGIPKDWLGKNSLMPEVSGGSQAANPFATVNVDQQAQAQAKREGLSPTLPDGKINPAYIRRAQEIKQALLRRGGKG